MGACWRVFVRVCIQVSRIHTHVKLLGLFSRVAGRFFREKKITAVALNQVELYTYRGVHDSTFCVQLFLVCIQQNVHVFIPFIWV